MPKIVKLVNQQIEVDHGSEIDAEASAQNGEAVMREFWEILFIDSVYGDVTSVKLSKERKDDMVKKLTGGVVLSSVT